MTIKQQGGIFGRNPTFNEVDATDITTESLSLLKNNPFVRLDDSDTDNNGEFRLDNTSVRIEADKDNAVAGSKIKFKIDNSEIGFFDENGHLDIDGNLVVASGQGIDFSATSGTGTSELFSDYEEGVWSPDLRDGAGGSVFASQANDGVYVKSGSMVWASAALFGASTSSSTDIVTINLPFAASSSKTNAAAPLVYSVGLGSAVAAYVQDGGSYLKFTKTIGSIGSNVLCNEVTTGLRGYFSIVYATV